MGSVIVALMEKTKLTTGLQLTHMEFSTMAISIAGNKEKTLFCVLVTDIGTSETLGYLLATQILENFADRYKNDLRKKLTLNVSLFQDFQYRLGTIIRESGKPVLTELVRNRGVTRALLVGEDPRHPGNSIILHSTGEVDHFGILANLEPLTSAAVDIAGLKGDWPNEIWLESSPSRASRLLVRKVIAGTYLVVQFSKRFESSHYLDDVRRATHLLEKVCLMQETVNRKT